MNSLKFSTFKTILFTFLIFYVLSSDYSPQPYTLRQDQVLVTKYQSQWIVQFICDAHIGPCKISYIFLPSGWSSDNQKLIIPIDHTKSIRNYLLQVNVSVPTGDSSVENILIDFNNGNIQLKINEVYRQNRFNKPTIENNRNMNNQNKEQSTEKRTNQKIETTQINSGQNLISLNEFISILTNGSIRQLTKVFQSLSGSDTQCSVKIRYLPQYIQQTQTILRSNQFNLQRIKSIKLNINEQIRNLSINRQILQQQIQQYQNKQISEGKLRKLRFQRSYYQSQYFRNQYITQAYKQRLRNTVKALGRNPQDIIKLRESINQDEQKIENIDEQIKKLIIERQYITRRLKTNKQSLKSYSQIQNSNVSPQKINELEGKIKIYSEISIRFRQNFDKLNREYEELLSQSQNNDQELTQLQQKLTQIQDKIQTQNQNISKNNALLQSASNHVQLFTTNLPLLKQQLLNCQNQFNNPVNIQHHPSSINIQQFRNKYPINQQIHSFTSDWIFSYGVPRHFRFDCSFTQNIIQGYGQIVDINNSIIKVQDLSSNTFMYELHIGYCSRIFADNPFYLPKKGDIIDWNGQASSSKNNSYNIFNANIYTK